MGAYTRIRAGATLGAGCAIGDHVSIADEVSIGDDVTIAELAQTVAHVTGYRGVIDYDPSKPDGTPRKLLDVSKCTALGWRARTKLGDGIAATYAWYVSQRSRAA